jgi:hypothetical protein
VRFDGHDGGRRVVVTHPGPAATLLVLLVLCLIVGITFLVVVGLVLLWIPVVIGGILLATAAVAIRHHWRQLRARWPSKD